jgi:triosephosphate isomerase
VIPQSGRIIVGNWKMHGHRAAIAEIETMAAGAGAATGIALWVAPPFTLIDRAVQAAGSAMLIGGQDCHSAPQGAHTGCISAPMLADLGAGFVILGHSERRQNLAETDAMVQAKVLAAQTAGLIAIVCVGETGAERDAGAAEKRVAAQLAGSLPQALPGLIIAYEPIWAIGTGRIPTLADVAAMHAAIRAQLVAQAGAAGAGVSILYGGSVTPANAAGLLALPDVGGVLVGGASLSAQSLLAIAAAG